jgi:hypothetical protein
VLLLSFNSFPFHVLTIYIVLHFHNAIVFVSFVSVYSFILIIFSQNCCRYWLLCIHVVYFRFAWTPWHTSNSRKFCISVIDAFYIFPILSAAFCSFTQIQLDNIYTNAIFWVICINFRAVIEAFRVKGQWIVSAKIVTYFFSSSKF